MRAKVVMVAALFAGAFLAAAEPRPSGSDGGYAWAGCSHFLKSKLRLRTSRRVNRWFGAASKFAVLNEFISRFVGGRSRAILFLGQSTLTLIISLASLMSDKNHPLVAKVLAEMPRFEKTNATGKYILGRSDFADHPVYQTKWLKFGLKALGLPDSYVIPKVADSYGALFWMDYRDEHIAGKDSDDRGRYPYLGWACDHFHGSKKSPLSNRDYPLTWEEHASEARYDGLKIISPSFVEKRLSPPHTWHAAEAFLLLLTE